MMTRVWASDVPRSSKSWRRRERYRRKVIFQAQFRSLEIKPLIWTLTPRDDVAGVPGQRLMVASETKTSAASEASSNLTGCGKESTSCSGKSSVGAPAVSYAAPVPGAVAWKLSLAREMKTLPVPLLQITQVQNYRVWLRW